MKRLLLFIAIIFAVINIANAQNSGAYYRQFSFNPYLFNPAFVGINNQSEVNLVYRQQWAGFEDAPTITGINFQHPTNGRVALGFSLNSNKQVLLRNSTFTSTFGYVVPLTTDQSLRFGLSGGIGLNTLDLTTEELNTNDPAIRNSGNNYYIDGKFGAVYTYSNLRVGFAFNDMFQSNSFESKTFTGFSFSNLKNRTYSVRYKHTLGVMEKIAIEPYVLYHQNADKLQNAWEAASLIYFVEKVWTGVGYNQKKGLAFFLGANIKDKFSFSYSYELPSNTGSTSSHELHLSLKFGKKKTSSARITAISKLPESEPGNDEEESKGEENKKTTTVAPQNKNTKTITPQAEKSVKKEGSKESVTVGTKAPEAVKKEIKVSPPVATNKVSSLRKPAKSAIFTTGHYVVVGAFPTLEQSKKYTKEMAQKGYNLTVSLNPTNKTYYAYIFSTFNIEDAKVARNEYRWKHIFKEAWVFSKE